MLVWLTAESMWRTDNKVYQPVLSKADLLSCLSTAMGLEHEPLLPNRVVNPQQPNSGAQCGAYGQWTGLHTHRCNTQLLGDIASHPQLRGQHHQLAHVGQPVANSISHTKNNFFLWKNTCELMTFTVRPTGQHQVVHNTITDTNSAGGLCSVTIGGYFDLFSHNPLHSQGECGDHKEPHSEKRSSHFIPRQTGSLSSEVVPGPTRADEEYSAVNFVIVPGTLNSNSARGTEHLWCQGHIWQLWYLGTVFGLVQVRLIFHFFATVPTPDQIWDLFA